MLEDVLARTYTASAEGRVLKNTYTVLAGTLLLTAAVTWFSQGIGLPAWVALVAMIASFVLLFVVHRLRNSGLGLLALFGFAALQGLGLAPVIGFYLHAPNGGATVAQAAGLTALAFFALSSYVHLSRRDFSALGGMLFVGLVIVVVAGVVGIFVPSQAYQMALAGVSALLFCGFILFDTAQIIHGGETNYILAAMRLYLDILNLFLSLLRLLSRRD